MAKQNNKKTMLMLTDSGPTPLKVSSNGNCVTTHTSNPKEWYAVLSAFYHDEVEEDNPLVNSHWKDNPLHDETDELLDTQIKYSNKTIPQEEINITVKLYHTTGSLCVQGSADSIQRWRNTQFPVLTDVSTVYQNREMFIICLCCRNW